MHIGKLKSGTNTEKEIMIKTYRKAKVFWFVQYGRSKCFKKRRTNENRVSGVHWKGKSDSMRQAVDAVKSRISSGNSKGEEWCDKMGKKFEKESEVISWDNKETCMWKITGSQFKVWF